MIKYMNPQLENSELIQYIKEHKHTDGSFTQFILSSCKSPPGHLVLHLKCSFCSDTKMFGVYRREE